jgi:hypothetical protein
MEDPDRFEPAHVRHEDIDDHQVELLEFESTQSGFTSIGNRHSKIVALEIDLDGHADHRVVVDDENMAQSFHFRFSFPFRRFNHRTVGHAFLLCFRSRHELVRVSSAERGAHGQRGCNVSGS